MKNRHFSRLPGITERASRFKYMARSRRQCSAPCFPRLHIDCALFAKGLRLGNTLGVCISGFKTHRQFRAISRICLKRKAICSHESDLTDAQSAIRLSRNIEELFIYGGAANSQGDANFAIPVSLNLSPMAGYSSTIIDLAPTTGRTPTDTKTDTKRIKNDRIGLSSFYLNTQ